MFRRITNRIIDNVEGVIVREATKALTPHIQEAAEGIIDAVANSVPTIRSTGGGTSVYLTKVKQDFKDFHAEDADTDIQTFLLEFLQLKYEGKQDFEKAKVSEKVLINMGDVVNSKLTNIKINHMAVGDYQKSLYSATIKYRVSVGFDLNGSRKEKLYEIEYTLRLRDEYGSQTFLDCQNCGAPLEENNGECTYCGMKHIRDTISSWMVTDIKEK
jgi:hypothetical protein